jgi:hypothetical protein
MRALQQYAETVFASVIEPAAAVLSKQPTECVTEADEAEFAMGYAIGLRVAAAVRGGAPRETMSVAMGLVVSSQHRVHGFFDALAEALTAAVAGGLQ